MVLQKCSEFETLLAGICFEAVQSNCSWVFYLLIFYLTCVCTGDGRSMLLSTNLQLDHSGPLWKCCYFFTFVSISLACLVCYFQ